MNRVVEIHVAGLDVHESIRTLSSRRVSRADSTILPAWTDAHAAPIPPVLFEMLDQILCHPRLANLRGLALEVDTKPAEMIVDEFAAFSRRYAAVFQKGVHNEKTVPMCESKAVLGSAASASSRGTMEEAYQRYFARSTGQGGAKRAGVE